MKKYILIGLISVLFFQAFNTKSTNVLIPEESISLRLLANYNNREYQQLKMEVSEVLQSELYTLLKDTKGINEARKEIHSHLPNLRTKVATTLQQQNNSLSFQLDYGIHYFPKKVYKGITYPEGNYESLLVTLGKGEGENWWCVLFPPLCIMEAEEKEDTENTEYKFFIQELIEKYL